ncbi:DNA-binding protein inhibitor ID-2b [Danio aesculapii]|uniref:DNA-binding protein inhibitor ID-2b n=1 Tax=Danio aesculapii TaxID=1142201 RepID=UPI0024BF8580|nr:DNA-binding protein inhibitor ID-2b [Danio aesculapii]
MKAVSPVRSVRKPALCFSEHNLGISRSSDPLSLLYNMNDCYSRLKELVPSLPQNRSVSKMEILQHVIDYILDLQIALDQNPLQQQQQQLSLGQSPPKKSVRSLGADISIISFQPSNPQREINTDDLIALSR